MTCLKDRMREALDESGKTQTGLAKACGVRPPSVNDWMSGKTKTLKAATAHRAAAFLGVNLLWLTEGRGQKRPDDDKESATAALESPSPELDMRSLRLDALRQAVRAMARDFGITPEDLVSGERGTEGVEDAADGPIIPPKTARLSTSEGRAERRTKDRRKGDRRASK